MSSDKSNLPRGWISTSLGEITEVSKDKISPNDLPGVPYVGLEHIQRDAGKLIGYGTSDEVKSTKSRFQKGDVLYGKLRPYLNKVCIPDFDGVCSTDILVFKRKDGIDNRFLQNTLLNRDFVSYANSNVSGVQHPRTNEKTIGKYPLLLPPLPEQHRIVNKIEELFTQLDAGVDLLRRAKVLLNQYRQSIMKAAFEGKLTEAWRRRNRGKFPTATILLEESKTEKAEKRPRERIPVLGNSSELDSIPDDWAYAPLSLFFSWSNGKGLTKKKMQGGRYPVYGGNGIAGTHDSFLTDNECMVIGRVGALCGNVHIAPSHSWVTDNAIYSDWSSSHISFKYVLYFLRQLDLNRLAGGSGQPYVNQHILNSISMPIPPRKEQDIIVQQIEEQLTSVDNLLETALLCENQTARLKIRILGRAFQGKLVSQDPADEPASKMLERIKDQRSGETPGRIKPRQTKMF